MADKLIFPIGFDLDKGVKEAADNWEGASKVLEAKIGKKPIKVNVLFSTKSLEDLENRLSKIKLAPIDDATKNNIRTLTAEMKGLAKALEAVNRVSGARAGASPDAVRAARISEVTRRADDKHEESLLRQRKLIAQAEAAEIRRAKAAGQTTSAYKSQTSYLERMVQRLAIYYSIGQVASFLSKVREVTAQFELQRVSLGAIIQDQARANALFSEIKQFALKSPVSVMDLTKYTKQVAAYRIETDKLFDTTKRLADVSVGLGVDMGRLVLAYGQVKAASYLRAAEIRQFTEAGIPLLELLAEKFTKLNGEAVTTNKVMDMVSKRMVGFEMVEEIFNDMTSAGGMFYNMQEKQGNTLFGMWAKLGDAASIMYDEIGNTEYVNSGMKELIRMLASLMRNWQSVARQMTIMGVEFAAYKLYTKTAAIYTNYLTAAQKLNTEQQYQMYQATMSQNRATRVFAALMGKLPISTSAAAAATKVFAVALRTLKAAFVTTGIGALVVGIAYLIEKLLFAKSTADEVGEALGDIMNETYTQQGQSTRNFEYLAKSALDTSKSYKEQQDALSELQRTYKDILPMEVMEIDYLKSLDGNYSSLTGTISKYVAIRQKQKAIDTIEEKYGVKLREYQLNLSEQMKGWGWSQEEIGRFWGAFRAYAEDSTKTVREMIKDAVDYAGKSPYFNKLIETRGFVSGTGRVTKYEVVDKNLQDYVKTTQEMLEAEKGVEAEYEVLANGADRFSKAIKDINKQMENYQPTALFGGEEKSVDADTFAGKQAQINKRVQELNTALRSEFNRGGQEILSLWSDTFSKIIKVVDAEKPEIISSIDFTEIIKAVSSKLNDNRITEEQRKYLTNLRTTVSVAQMEYNKFVPNDNTMITWNAKMRELAEGVGVVEKKYTQYLMKSDEGLKDWNKRLKDSVEELKNSIKSLIATKALMDSSGIFDPKVIEQTEADIKDQEQRLELLEKLLALMPSFSEKKTPGGADNRVQQEKEYLSVLEKVYSKYKELKKSMSDTEALQFMNKYYRDSITYLEKHGLGLAKNADEYKNYISVVKANMQKLAKDKNKTVASAAKKEVAEIDVKLGDVDFGEMKTTIEKKLKQLSEEIAQSKIAKEFFDKMLSETGDVDLATSITVSIYGDTGGDLFQKAVEQIKAAFQSENIQVGVEIGGAINEKDKTIDYEKLAKVYEKYKGDLLESNLDLIKTIIKNGQSASAEQIKTWQKELAKAKDYEQKRTDIIKKEEQRRRDILKSTQPTEVKQQLISASYSKQAQDLTKLSTEEFKNSEDYIKVFQDLDAVSGATLDRMQGKLEDLIKTTQDTENAEGLKVLVDSLEKIKTERIERSPIASVIQSFEDYRAAREEFHNAEAAEAEARAAYAEEQIALDNAVAVAQEKVNFLEEEGLSETSAGVQAQEQLTAATEAQRQAKEKVSKAAQRTTNALDKQKKAGKTFEKSVRALASGFNAIADAIEQTAELFGVMEDSDAGDIVGGIVKGFRTASSILTTVLTIMIAIKLISQTWMLYVTAAVAAIAAVVSIFTSNSSTVRKADAEISAQEKVLNRLERAYKKLQDRMEKTFGAEYINNYNQRLSILQQQAVAKQKQYRAELSKGKDADEDAAERYYEEYLDILDEIEDIKANEIAERMFGTDIGSAAVEFAKAWLDAYVSFENTADAISEKFNDMMQNMVVQSILAGAIEAALSPLFEKITEYSKSGGKLEDWEIQDIVADSATAAESIDGMLTAIVEGLKAAGIDVRSLGKASDDTSTGIKRDIATASEESINGLAVGINTQNFYIAQIHENVALIAKKIQGGGEQIDIANGSESLTLQHLAYLPTIAQNTAETVTRCERAAIACEDMATQISRVIKPRGVESQFVMNVN